MRLGVLTFVVVLRAKPSETLLNFVSDVYQAEGKADRDLRL
jgi:hypothetical protein